MDEKYGVKGCVRRLEQRRSPRFDAGPLRLTRDHNSFDVEFSDSGLVLQATSYTYGGDLYRSTRFEYDGAGRVIRSATFDNSEVTLGHSELSYSESQCVWRNYDAQKILTSHGIDKYNGQCLVLTSTFDDLDKPKRVKNFEYLDGKLAKSHSRYYLPDGILCEQQVTDYDSKERILRTYGLKPDGSPLGDGKYLHEYDGEGRTGRVWTFNEFTNDKLASRVTIYEYTNDVVGNWIERQVYPVWREDSYRSKSITTRKLTYYGETAPTP